MPRSADERDAISLLYAPSLFLPAAEGEEVPAPVVILQNDPANVYGILETHFRSDCLPQPDRFWRIVRSTPPIPFETWRPRVNGVQLKANIYHIYTCSDSQLFLLEESNILNLFQLSE